MTFRFTFRPIAQMLSVDLGQLFDDDPDLRVVLQPVPETSQQTGAPFFDPLTGLGFTSWRSPIQAMGDK